MDKAKIAALPQKPGVYIFKDAAEKVIYIGKAKILRNRVKSYFQEGKKDIKTMKLSEKIADMDYIVTRTELEAFILENSLIKEHKPRYNIMLKDDKSYPYITVTAGNKYPGVYVTRNTKDKKAVYFGPFFALDAKRVVQLIYRVFKIRQCTLDLTGKPLKRPCIYYDTGVCSAPCVRFITDGAYAESVKEVRKFLNGSYKKTLEELKKQMEEYSGKKEYEKAAEARDAMLAVEEIMKEQKMVDAEGMDRDVVNYAYKGNAYFFCVLNIRNGRLINKAISVFSDMPPQEGALEGYLSQYYSRSNYFPSELLLPEAAASREILENAVLKGKGVKIITRKRDALLNMALENIEEKIKQEAIFEEKKKGGKEEGQKQLLELQEALEMKDPPLVIDGIDISHHAGSDMVGSCVVFNGGQPDKNNYRRYKIKTVAQVDDPASIAEVVRRRYSRMLEEKKPLPDLILIDGGIGQVNAAKEELEKLDIYPEVIGLAKKEEKIYRPYENIPVELPVKARFLLMRVRDEAHRFANAYRFQLANKNLKKSVFDDIPFIGKKTKQEIYMEFRDVEELLSELGKESERVKFLNKKQKELIKKHLSK